MAAFVASGLFSGLAGTAHAQTIDLTTPQDIGNATVTQPVDGNITIGNAMGAAGDLLVMAIATDEQAGDNCSAFAIDDSGLTLAISMGNTATVPVIFTAPTDGFTQCTLAITSNDAGSPTQLVIRGTGLAPAIDVTSPQTVGSVAISATVSGNFSIDNGAGAMGDLIVTAINLDAQAGDTCGAFSIDTSGLSAPIGAGMNATIPVDFTAPAAGTSTCTLSILSNDPTSPTALEIQGIGLASQITLASPQSMGNANLTQTVTGNIVIGNDVTAWLDLSVTAITPAPQGVDDCTRFVINPMADPLPSAIMPGDTAMVPAEFTPLVDGLTTCTVSVASNDPDSPDTLVLAGIGLAPQIGLPNDPLNVGGTPVGVTLNDNLTISNDMMAAGDLLLSAITPAPVGDDDCSLFVLNTAMVPSTIPAGMAQLVPIAFTPTTAGTFTCTISITSNDTGSPHSLVITGTGQEQNISVDMASLSFGNQRVGLQSAAMTVTIENIGDLPLAIMDIAVGGMHDTDFAATPSTMPMFTMMPGDTETVDVTFNPGALGGRSGRLDIMSDDPDTMTFSIPLDGTGVEPDIAVSDNALDFSQILVTNTSGAQTITITNNGDWDLTVMSIAPMGGDMGDFAATPSQMLPHVLSMGEQMTVDVTFTPSMAGNRSSTLEIVSDDPDTMTATVTLMGDGMESPIMTLSTMMIDFGDQLEDTTSAAMTFDVMNQMGAFRFPLNVSNIALISGDTGDFAIDVTSAVVAQDDAQTVSVTFTPSATGARSAVIRVTGDDPVTPTLDVAVTGFGRKPTISVDIMNHDFGLIPLTQSSGARTVTVTNIGNSDLTISSAAYVTGAEFSFAGNNSTTIMAGDNETWDLFCTPMTLGTLADAFVFTSDDPDNGTVSVNVNCEGIATPVSVNPVIDFPDTYIGDTSSALSIDIINNTSLDIDVTNVTVSDNVYTVMATVPFTLNGLNDTETIMMDFSPIANQNYAATLSLDTSLGVLDFAVSGRGVVSLIQVTTGALPPDPPLYDFGDIKVTESSLPQQFTITNTGTFPFTIMSVSVDDFNSFPITDPGMTTLNEGDTVDFTVTAVPQTAGPILGRVTIEHDIRNVMYTTFDVRVEGTTGVLELSDTSVDFGPVDVQASLPVTYQVTVTNQADSTDTLEISDIRLVGDPVFTMPLGQPTASSLDPGEPFTVTLAYTPTVESDSDDAMLQIDTDAEGAMMVQIPVTGRGIDRHIAVSALTVNFPNTIRNPEPPAQETVTIRNTGDAPLAITMFVRGGADPDVFSVPNEVMQVAPMSEQDVVVEFAPTAENPDYNATLTIVNDDSDTPMVDIALQAASFVPNVALLPGSTTMTMQTGQSVPLRLSDLAGGPIALTNMDPDNAFTVRDVRVVGMDGNPLPDDVFRIVGVEPNTELGPMATLDIDVELLSAEPGTFDGVVEVYLGGDPVRIAFLPITGEVFAVEVRGGCDASSGSHDMSGALGLGLALAGLALIGRMRRRRRMGARVATAFVVALVGSLGVAPAHADNPRNLDLNTFRPVPSIESGMLSVESADVGDSGAWSLKIAVDHAVNPLTVRALDQADDVPIAGRTAAGVMASFAFLDRFELGALLPVLQQSGEMPTFSGITPADGTAIGDVGVHLKAKIADISSISLAGSAMVTIPTASDGMFAGVDGPSGHLRAIAGMSSKHVRLALNLGAWIRGTNTLGDAEQGSAFTYGLAAEYRFLPKLTIVGELYGSFGLGAEVPAAVSPIEATVGFRYRMSRALSVSSGVGRGLTAGIGAPSARGVLLIAYSPKARTISAFEQRERVLATVDSDGDGIPDREDQCKDEEEDKDLFDDSDGCPDWDNDGDGIDDSLDKCPLRPEDKDNYQDEDGCPDNDNDGDKVADKDDKCPDVPEDMDGFNDLDGCDDPDNDEDGVPDVIDLCVLEPETINGNNDEDGCPDDGDSLVMVMADRLELFEPIVFRGIARLDKKSKKVLVQVAATLRARVSMVKVRIGVHVHPVDDNDTTRSELRAVAIRDWLINWGIAPERLLVKGYGSEQQLVPKNQRGAKAINERVEFIVVEKALD